MEALIQKWHEHGVSVHDWYNRILKDPQILECDEISNWVENEYIPIEGIENYHVNHDMGKPYVVWYDQLGKAHYPGHSEKSYEMYVEKFGHDDFAEMIRYDMGFHTWKGEELEKLCKMEIAPYLYITAWAELFANAEMFGGRESDSYKIKRKKLLKAWKILQQA